MDATTTDSVRVIIMREGRYLLAQHNNKRPENIGKWGLLGGHVDACDASHAAAIRREMEEELRIRVAVGTHVHTYTHRERNQHVYQVTLLDSDLQPDPAEILALRWFTLAQVCVMQQDGQLHTGFELDAIRRARGG